MMAGRSAHECGGRGRGVGRVRGVLRVLLSAKGFNSNAKRLPRRVAPTRVPNSDDAISGGEGVARRVNSGLEGGLFRVVGRLKSWRRRRLARMALSDAVFWRRECCWPRKVCKVGWAAAGSRREVAPRFVYSRPQNVAARAHGP